MKEELKNSLEQLSNVVDDLSRGIFYLKNNSSSDELEFYKQKYKDCLKEIEILKEQLSIKTKKIEQAVVEVQSIKVMLKNKLTDFKSF